MPLSGLSRAVGIPSAWRQLGSIYEELIFSGRSGSVLEYGDFLIRLNELLDGGRR